MTQITFIEPSGQEVTVDIKDGWSLMQGATSGGVDGIVFSGAYAELGSRVGPWLAARLTLPGGPRSEPPWTLLRRSLPEVMADAARALLANAAPAHPTAIPAA